jgi:hypothetical protein
MRRGGVKIIVALLFLGIFLAIASTALAAPVPPLRIANHDTLECATIFGGDECMDCFPVEGWEILGDAFDVPCPDGYIEIDNPDYYCEAFKSEWCCTEDHSGAPGDCTDLVIHKGRKECAFVSDVTAVGLPRGWRGRQEDTPVYDWNCPYEYEWVESPEVETGSEEDAGRGINVPCMSSPLLLVPAALVVVAHRKKSETK